jgi:hypothetical protein
LIIAPSYDVLNQWFETVKSRVADNVIWRVSEDFYVFDRNKLDLGRSTAPNAQAPQFMNKLIFQLQNDNGGRGISTFTNGSNRSEPT